MAGRFPHPKFQATVAGVALPGAKLYIYETGTTTKVGAGVALDSRSGSDVANPLIMDANGEADLWLKPGSQYTLKLDNSADVQQWSVDGVSANDLEAWISSGNDISYQAGNVGIGGDAGTETLLVTGSCKITSTLEVDGTASLDGSVVVNEGGSDSASFRVETDTNDHMIYTDPSLNQLLLGNSTFATAFVGISSSQVQITRTLNITGETFLTDDLNVIGDLDLTGAVDLTGDFDIDGNIELATEHYLAVKGGLAVDFIGRVTLNGTSGAPVNKTNITANDRVMVTRAGTSSGYGELYVTRSVGSQFVIYSTDASDDGLADWFIVRQT